MIGAATSPKLNCSVVGVNLYVGLNALDWIWRKSLLFASISVVIGSAVQNALVVSNTVWLKTWLLPKKASERLLRVRTFLNGPDECHVPEAGIMFQHVVLIEHIAKANCQHLLRALL